VSWRELAPEPARCWIRHHPKRWPSPEQPVLDPVERRITWPGGDSAVPLPRPPAGPRIDVVFVPVVPRARRAERERWILDLERAGGAALVAVELDEAAEPAATGTRLVDLLEPVLAGAPPAALDLLPPEVSALLPLLPGITAEAESWRPWLAALGRAGRRAVVGLAPDLTPSDRRRLAERAGEASYEGIFHGDAPSESAFARAAAAAGLEPWLARPEVDLSPRRARNRELATVLAEAGDLAIRLGRAEAEGSALLAAARHLEASPLDVAALAREGNLAVLSWMAAPARRMVEAQVDRGRIERLEELRAQWRRGEPA
jgi:hypothetical protein